MACPLSWDLPSHGSEPSERLLVYAERRIVKLNELLTPEQRQAVANLAVFGFHPPWFMAAQLRLRPLPSDERDRETLLSGLDILTSAAPEPGGLVTA